MKILISASFWIFAFSASAQQLICDLRLKIENATEVSQASFELIPPPDTLIYTKANWYDEDYNEPNDFRGFIEVSATVCLSKQDCDLNNLSIELSHKYYDPISRVYKVIASKELATRFEISNDEINLRLDSVWGLLEFAQVECHAEN